MYTLTIIAAWIWLTLAASNAWKAFMKLPGWAVLVVLTLGAICWWLYEALKTKTVLSEIQMERVKVETDYKEAVEKILDKESAEGERIKEDYEKNNKVIDEKEQELFKSVSKGPVEIAKEWDKYLRGKNEE